MAGAGRILCREIQRHAGEQKSKDQLHKLRLMFNGILRLLKTIKEGGPKAQS